MFVSMVELDADELSRVIGGCDPNDVEHEATVIESEGVETPLPMPMPMPALEDHRRVRGNVTPNVNF